jgi:hypothetical protein
MTVDLQVNVAGNRNAHARIVAGDERTGAG